MTIKKQYLKSKPEVKITFEIEKENAQDAATVALLSEHNNWQALEFKKLKSGKFKLAFNVSTENLNSFQYIFEATTNDNQKIMLLPINADNYVDNGMTDGGKNALLEIK